MKRICWILSVVFLLRSDVVFAAASPEKTAEKIWSLAFQYLQRTQHPNGSYGKNVEGAPIVGTTALVVYAMATSKKDKGAYREIDGPFVSEAVKFLLTERNEDGSFGRSEKRFFETLATVLALEALQNPVYLDAIAAAKGWLERHSLSIPLEPLFEKTVWSLGLDPSSFSAERREAVLKGEFATIATLLYAWHPVDRPEALGVLAEKLLQCEALLALGMKQISDASGNSTDVIASIIAALQPLQHRDDTTPEYGRFVGLGGYPEEDPIVATTFVAILTDRVITKYAKLK